MKQRRHICLFLCVFFTGLIITFVIQIQPELFKINIADSATKSMNRGTDHRLTKEVNEGGSKPAKKDLTRGETPLKFRAGYWHNQTRFACKFLNMSTDVPRYPGKLQVVVDDKHKLIMCLNAKGGSTYFTAVFAILLGQNPAKDPNDIPVKNIYRKDGYKHRQPLLRNMPYKERLMRQATYYSAIFVREPFGRLLSAYRNKIEKSDCEFAKLARKMRRNGETNRTTTFLEFVEYILTSNDPNTHWRPYYRACLPCSMNYDFVGKMETMDEDVRHIFEEVNVTDIIVPPKPATHTADVYLEKYYKQVPKKTLWKVYERYKPDFVIFDYSIPEVIKSMMT